MVQWLSLCTSYTRDMGSMPGWETKIPYSTGCGKKKKRERNYIVTWLPKNRYIWKIWILPSLYGSLLQALFHCWDNPVCYIIVIFSFNSLNMVSLNFLSISVIADLRSWLNTAFGLTQNLSIYCHYSRIWITLSCFSCMSHHVLLKTVQYIFDNLL